MKRSSIIDEFILDLTYLGELNDGQIHLLPHDKVIILSYPFIKFINHEKVKIFSTLYLTSDSGEAGVSIPAGYTLDYAIFEHYDSGAGENVGFTFVIMKKDGKSYVIIGEI